MSSSYKSYILVLLFGVLIFLSFFTRFYNLSEPAAVVFDEVYFPQFSADYLAGKYFFDIHPPHGKLLFAASFYLLGLPTDINWQALSKSQEFIDSEISFKIRFLPALFGALLVLLVYFLVFIVSRSQLAAFLSASFILLDNSFLVQSRFCLMDIILVFFSLLALLFYFLARQNLSSANFCGQAEQNFSALIRVLIRVFPRICAKSRTRTSNQLLRNHTEHTSSVRDKLRGAHMCWILCGISLGMACGIKITGLAVLGILAFFETIELLIRIFTPYNPKIKMFICDDEKMPEISNQKKYYSSRRGYTGLKKADLGLRKKIFAFFCLIVLPFFVYYLGFAIHFKFIGTDGGAAAMDSAPIFSFNTLKQTIVLNEQMLSANVGISQTHPFQSKWWMWPFGEKRIYYWRNIDEPAGIKNIWLAANKTLWYFSEIAVFLSLIFVFGLFRKTREKIFKQFEKRRPLIVLLLLLYFVFWLPLVFIGRPLFLYHYLPSISFAFMILSLLLSDIAGKKTRYAAIGLVLIAVLWNFVSLLPITYGY